MTGMFAEVWFELQASSLHTFCLDVDVCLTKKIFQDILNLTYELSTPPDMQFGSLNPDGTWTGMINELIHKRADIGTVDHYWNQDCLNNFNYCFQLYLI